MTKGKHSLEIMGGRLANIQDRILQERDVLNEIKEEMSFDPAAYAKQKSRLGPIIGAAAAAGIAVVIVFSLLLGNTDRAIAVEVDGEALAEGDWISASGGAGTRLTFSEGSAISLQSRSGVRIQALYENGAHLLLEQGMLDVDIIHRDNTRWQLDVGPYIVNITGTRFKVSWHPANEVFNLEMREGAVDVKGPMILSGKTVVTGESMVASLTDGRLEIFSGKGRHAADDEASAPAVPEEASPSAESPEPSKAQNDNAPNTDRQRYRHRRHVHGTSRWKTLADAGDFAAALRAIKRNGAGGVINTASAGDLLMLGDAARHGGELKLATKIYKAARRRFKGSPHAVRATFALGLMAFDQKGAHLEAAKWFSMISKNRPKRGLLVKEAAGRLVEALHHGGDAAGARTAAERYLEQYPNGPHAALAKRLTE